MNPPLGFKDTNVKKITVAKAVNEMNLAIDDDGFVYYHDVLYAVYRRVYGTDLDHDKVREEEYKTKRKLERIKRALTRTSHRGKTKKNVANPTFKMLLIEMTFMSWKNYADKYYDKIKTAEDAGVDYISSEESFEEEDSEDEREALIEEVMDEVMEEEGVQVNDLDS